MKTTVKRSKAFGAPGQALLDLSPRIALNKGDVLKSDSGNATVLDFMRTSPPTPDLIVLVSTNIPLDQLPGTTLTV